MKKLFFALIFCFLCCAVSNSSAQNLSRNKFSAPSSGAHECADIKFTPDVHFSTSWGKLEYDYKKTQKDITQLGSNTMHRESGIFLSGLSTVSIDDEAEVGVITKVTEDNVICVIPQTVNVYVGLSRPKIYISKELKPGSCSYNLVMRHEQTHQRINKAVMEYYIPIFQAAAQKIAASLKPVKIESYAGIDAASKNFSRRFYAEFSKVIKVFKKELKAEQLKLDNKKNYKREGDICRRRDGKH